MKRRDRNEVELDAPTNRLLLRATTRHSCEISLIFVLYFINFIISAFIFKRNIS